MTYKEYTSLMSARKIASDASNVDLEEIEKKVREQLSLAAKKELKLSKERKEQIISAYIADNSSKWRLPSFINAKGELDAARLLERIEDDVINYGILQKPIFDESVDEIRCNGRWVVVCYNDKRGTQFLRDDNGQLLYFKSVEEQTVILNRMIEGDLTVFNLSSRLANGRTLEQYRISIVHGSSVSRSAVDNENGYATVTIRKFRTTKLELEDMIGFGGLSDDMGRFLKFIASKASFVTVGPTFSGKTTLNRALLAGVDPWKRTICIQSPTEIDLRDFDAQGNPLNDRVMWEAEEGAKGQKDGEAVKSTATINNLIAQTLRNSPEIISINEVRHPDEFHSILTVAQAGHIINTTFHSASPKEACDRFTNELISDTHQDYATGLKNVCEAVKFIICQKKLADGSRKITDIAEICGIDPEHPSEPIINMLYQFKVTKIDKNENGKPIKIHGFHKKVGNLSPEMRRALSYEGVSEEDFTIIDPHVDAPEKLGGAFDIDADNGYTEDMATYEGKNINL